MEKSLWPFFIDFVDKRRHRSRFSTFWIKNLLIPYVIREIPLQPMEKTDCPGIGLLDAGAPD
jgi:hypothetical protein